MNLAIEILALWLLLSLPAAILIGRFMRHEQQWRQAREHARQAMQRCPHGETWDDCPVCCH